MKVSKSPLKLYASATAVINQFLYLPGKDRVKNIMERIEKFSEDEVNETLAGVMNDFAARHRDMEEVFRLHYDSVISHYEGDSYGYSDNRKMLVGAFFTKEYAIQAAALFNPSIVAHPDQQGLATGVQRFIMSLRATGEGHISSLIFKTGTVDGLLNIVLDKEPVYFTRLRKNIKATYSREFIRKRVVMLPGFDNTILESLPDSFTASTAHQLLQERMSKDAAAADSIRQLEEVMDTNYELQSAPGMPVSEKVIFPTAKSETMGMEDARFVKFSDEHSSCYYATYTAYDGKQIKTQLIETANFNDFRIRTLYGPAISDKGMALFPEKVNGQYVMIARQGGEKISIMFSEDLYCWENFAVLMEPKYSWELVQLGNCGSPVKTGKGWLLLTHGVGAMRTYVISAILLDLIDPSKIIGRLDKPLLTADESEREGYVPNVVYTCGLLLQGDKLIIPYAVSDSATGFVTIGLNELLDEMTT